MKYLIVAGAAVGGFVISDAIEDASWYWDYPAYAPIDFYYESIPGSGTYDNEHWYGKALRYLPGLTLTLGALAIANAVK